MSAVSCFPTIAFDGPSGSVLCKADGGGRYETLDVLKQLERRISVDKRVTEHSSDPRAGLARVSFRTSSRGALDFSVLIRRARVDKRLDIDPECRDLQRRGDFLPLGIEVGGNGPVSLLSLLDSLIREKAAGAHQGSSWFDDPSASVRRGIRKYWHNSVEFVRVNQPPVCRFVVINDVPAEVLSEAARTGTPMDIQLRLCGIVYYQRFTALAWEVDMVRAYEEASDAEPESEAEEVDDEDEEEGEAEVVADRGKVALGDCVADQTPASPPPPAAASPVAHIPYLSPPRQREDGDAGVKSAAPAEREVKAVKVAPAHVLASEPVPEPKPEPKPTPKPPPKPKPEPEVEPEVEPAVEAAPVPEPESSRASKPRGGVDTIYEHLRSEKARLLQMLESEDMSDGEEDIMHRRLNKVKRRLREVRAQRPTTP